MKFFWKTVRYKEWFDSKLNFYMVVFLYFVLEAGGHYTYKTLFNFGVFIIYGIFYLSFGYAFNDFCDYKEDLKAGKKNLISQLSKTYQFVLLGTLILAGLLPTMFYFKSIGISLIALFTYCIAWLYSIKTLKLKEKFFLGPLISASAQRVFPLFYVFVIFNTFNLNALLFSLLSLFIGIRWILIHQYEDFGNDETSDTKTFVRAIYNKASLVYIVSFVFVGELLALIWIISETKALQTASSEIIGFLYLGLQVLFFPFWRKIGWRRMILSYDFAPLSDVYYIWLPCIIFANLIIVQVIWVLLIPVLY